MPLVLYENACPSDQGRLYHHQAWWPSVALVLSLQALVGLLLGGSANLLALRLLRGRRGTFWRSLRWLCILGLPAQLVNTIDSLAHAAIVYPGALPCEVYAVLAHLHAPISGLQTWLDSAYSCMTVGLVAVRASAVATPSRLLRLQRSRYRLCRACRLVGLALCSLIATVATAHTLIVVRTIYCPSGMRIDYTYALLPKKLADAWIYVFRLACPMGLCLLLNLLLTVTTVRRLRRSRHRLNLAEARVFNTRLSRGGRCTVMALLYSVVYLICQTPIVLWEFSRRLIGSAEDELNVEAWTECAAVMLLICGNLAVSLNAAVNAMIFALLGHRARAEAAACLKAALKCYNPRFATPYRIENQ